MKTIGKGIIALSLLCSVAACNPASPPTSDQIMNRQQEQMSREAAQQAGLPAIVNFFEKKVLKTIIELRDKGVSTTTYVFAENGGQLFKVCDSIGFGFPYATQYTNPLKLDTRYGINGTAHYVDGVVAQADPNGLFSPAAAEGTWVMCVDPSDKKDKPVYIEPKVIVSPFPIVLTPVPFGK